MDTIINICGNSILVDRDNRLFDIRSKKEISVLSKGKENLFLFLKNEHGKTIKINYGLIILYATKRFFLPFESWDKVEVDFLDEDENNYLFDNLYLKYPDGGIEHQTHKGFYYIPGFELNLINKSGTILRLITGKTKEPVITEKHVTDNKQYVYMAIDVNELKSSSMVIHRLLAMTFKNPPKGYPKLIVDHLNGLKYDFDLGNLEWVTSQVNNLRAVQNGLKKDGKVILVKDKETGIVNEYFSITEFAREMDIHPQYVIDGKNNPNHTFRKRYVIKDINDERDWDYFENIKLSGEGVKIKAKNIHTSIVTHYPSVKQAAKLTNTHQNAIAQYFRNNSKPAIINGYEFKLEDDNTPWTVFNKYQIEIYQKGLHRNTTVYEVTDIDSKETFISYGWRLLNKLTGADKRTIINIGKLGRVLNNKYKLKILH